MGYVVDHNVFKKVLMSGPFIDSFRIESNGFKYLQNKDLSVQLISQNGIK